ncbi:MAG: efflux RND transporter periplasmic adaptor subunit [Leptospiraceae bacterium]|nr:efflux RND transporter periplasmic adaptor subunit [Leptospiraceae bacterium]
MKHLFHARKRNVAGAVILTLAGFTTNHCRNKAPETGPLAPEVKTVKVKKRNLVRNIEKGATVSYFEKASVSAPMAGTLEEFFVHEGDRVHRNQKLAQLETLQLRMTVRRAKAQEESALSRWHLSRSRLKKARKASERRLASLETRRSNVVESRTRFIRARNQLKAKKDIFELGGISREEMKDVYAGYVSALAAYYRAKKKLQDSRIGYRKKDLEEANMDIPGDASRQRKALQKLDTSSNAHQVQVARAAYRKAKLQRESARQMLSEATIRAPIEGVVARRNKEPGEAIEAGKPFLSIVSTDKLLVTTSIPEKELPYIQKGQLALMSADAYPSVEFEGKIRRISPVVDPKTRTFEIGVLITNDSEHSLAPGMFARLKIRTREIKNAISIPRKALLSKEGTRLAGQSQKKMPPKPRNKAEVFLIRGDHAFRRTVTLGESFGQSVQVLSGLKEGDRLAVSNLALLKDGMPIRSREENAHGDRARADQGPGKGGGKG